MNKNPDFLVIGAGIVGLTLALELKKQFPDASVQVLEKEKQPGLHASGRNSGVLHAGFYYTADSLKAQLCRDGNMSWRDYCAAEGLSINQCGKLVVARNEQELNGLDELYRRGQVNGVELDMISADEAAAIEPQVFTHERALWSPNTATVNPREVVSSILRQIESRAVSIDTNTAYISKDKEKIITSQGAITANYVINTAGLYADKIARDYGFSSDYRILPFKGLYLYANDRGLKLRTNVYPYRICATCFSACISR